jgi:hypothetical protein
MAVQQALHKDIMLQFLADHVKYYKSKYNLDCLVETGSYTGGGIATALSLGFETIYSCDLSLEFFNICRNLFCEDKVKLYHARSVDFLKEISSTLKYKKVFFWLDAHFPEYLKQNPERMNNSLWFPLFEELSIIKNIPVADSVIMVDDLRVYPDFCMYNDDAMKPYKEICIIPHTFKDLLDEMCNYHTEIIYEHTGVAVFTR